MFKFVVSKLRMHPHILDDLTPYELYLAAEGYHEDRREFFELMAMAVAHGIQAAFSGKWTPMFEEEKRTSKRVLTPEEVEEEIRYIEAIMDGKYEEPKIKIPPEIQQEITYIESLFN